MVIGRGYFFFFPSVTTATAQSMYSAAYVHGTQKGLSPSHEYVGGGGGYGLRAEKVPSLSSYLPRYAYTAGRERKMEIERSEDKRERK